MWVIMDQVRDIEQALTSDQQGHTIIHRQDITTTIIIQAEAMAEVVGKEYYLFCLASKFCAEQINQFFVLLFSKKHLTFAAQ